MAIDFNKLYQQAKQAKKEGKKWTAESSCAIRFRSNNESQRWASATTSTGQGAGYGLAGPAQLLKEKLITTIKFSKSLRDPPECLMILRDAPMALSDTYSFGGKPTLRKINNVAGSSFVASLKLGEYTDEDAADFVFAIITPLPT